MVLQNENTRGVKGLCLEVHDLLVAKAIAAREKDLDFLRQAARHGLADERTLLERVETTPADATRRDRAKTAIARAFGADP